MTLPASLGSRAGGGVGARYGSGAAIAPPRRRSAGRSAAAAATGSSVVAPMQATVVKLAVEEGQHVVKGDLVLVLEAMKMEQPVSAHRDGTVSGIDAAVGSTVSSGHVLLSIGD